MTPTRIDREDLALRCSILIRNAVDVLGPDLGGGSPLDLCADNMLDVDASLEDLQRAIVAANVAAACSKRVRARILSYAGHVCGMCGAEKPAGQSCGCFDNGCQ